jgi:hypothetical protein
MKDKLDTLLDEAKKKYSRAEHLAVENFCMSAPDDHFDNAANLINDAKSYKWSNSTVFAIRYVLKELNKL